jgi:hypothetical protein
MKLYEIKEQFLRLADMELDEQTMNDTLESLAFELEEKADNIACLIKQLTAESEAIKAESKNLAERAKAKEAKADKLTQYLFETFKAVGADKVETARNVIAIKKNPCSVVLDEGFSNSEYMVEKVSIQPDKEKIKSDLKNGVEIAGAKLEQKERLAIK